MEAPNVSLGLDVGGSHVTASVVDMSFAAEASLHLVRREIDSFAAASAIVAAIGDCIKAALAGKQPVAGIGIAFPGPFNYPKGVCTVLHVGGKFEQMFGLHLGQALKDATGMPDTPFRFFNDAHCFAVGAYARNGLKSRRTVFLTLGSGFGSSFMEDGELVTHHAALPRSCAFYNEPFRESIADDYFSTRWFHDAYKQATGQAMAGVRELAEMDSEISSRLFREFGANLGEFLLPWLEKFGCDELVIGGNIARAGHLFSNTLENRLKALDHKVHIVFCEDTEACILTGAACLAKQEVPADTTELAAPVYDTDLLVERLRHEKAAAIDGFGVRSWENVRQHLHAALTAAGRNVLWYDIEACLKTPAIDDKPAGSFGNGFHSLDDQKIRVLRPDASADLCIVYGTGAALCGWEGKLVNLDAALETKPVL
jgi:glucokinase